MSAIENAKFAAVLGVVGVGGYLAWKAYKGASGLADGIGAAASNLGAAVGETLSTTLNPASDQNIVNTGANAIGAAVTGDQTFSVGGAIYETVNGGEGSFWGNYSKWASDFWSFGGPPAVLDSAPQASYDETDRLLKRYPVPSEGGATGGW